MNRHPRLARLVVHVLLAIGAAAALPVAATPEGAVAARPEAPRPGATLAAMVEFDAAYIPALAATTAAAQKPAAAAQARAAADALVADWPALRAGLLAAWGDAPPPAWRDTIVQVDRYVAAVGEAVQRGAWSPAHEELEHVRIALMKARIALGMDYFVDRLSAFHEPMEVLALAGASWEPAELTPQRRTELARAYAEASALWARIEQAPPDPAAHGLSPQRKAQLEQGLAQERAALAALGRALQGSDDAALLQAAAAIKPPFARVFTAFGRTAAERQP